MGETVKRSALKDRNSSMLTSSLFCVEGKILAASSSMTRLLAMPRRLCQNFRDVSLISVWLQQNVFDQAILAEKTLM